MLPVSLDCPFLIATSVFSNVYLSVTTSRLPFSGSLPTAEKKSLFYTRGVPQRVTSWCIYQHQVERAKTSWLGIRIMWPSGATCLPADCCFNELVLYKSSLACWSSTKRTSPSYHWKLTWSRHDRARKIAELALNYISLTQRWLIDFIVFSATFSYISAISWRPVLVVEEDRVPEENHRPWASNW